MAVEAENMKKRTNLNRKGRRTTGPWIRKSGPRIKDKEQPANRRRRTAGKSNPARTWALNRSRRTAGLELENRRTENRRLRESGDLKTWAFNPARTWAFNPARTWLKRRTRTKSHAGYLAQALKMAETKNPSPTRVPRSLREQITKMIHLLRRKQWRRKN